MTVFISYNRTYADYKSHSYSRPTECIESEPSRRYKDIFFKQHKEIHPGFFGPMTRLGLDAARGPPVIWRRIVDSFLLKNRYSRVRPREIRHRRSIDAACTAANGPCYIFTRQDVRSFSGAAVVTPSLNSIVVAFFTAYLHGVREVAFRASYPKDVFCVM